MIRASLPEGAAAPSAPDLIYEARDLPQAVLLIGPEGATVNAWRAELERQGFAVEHESDPMLGVASARASGVALVVIHMAYEPGTGVQAIRTMRDEGNPATILALTAPDDAAAAVEVIECGADSCTNACCSPRELAARLHALIRRQRPGDVPTCTSWMIDDLRVDAAGRRVWRDGQQITLTPREFAVFVALLRRRGRVVSIEELLRDVWRERPTANGHAVEDTISGLRHKLWRNRSDARIHTVRSGGYIVP